MTSGADGAAGAAPPAERRSVLLVTCLSSFLTPFLGSALNLAIPAIGAEWRVSAVGLNWIVGAYLVASAAFLMPLGRLADLHGRRRVFLVGALAHALFSGGAALAWSPGSLIAFRFLQGIGGAMLFATGLALLTRAFPSATRGRALGINSASVYAGLSLGPVVGGLLTAQLGWRSIFAVNAVAAVALAGVTLRRIGGEWRGRDAHRHWDPTGALIYAVSLGALLLGTSALRSVVGAGWLLLLGAAGLLGFLLRERSRAEPMLDVRLFAAPAFAFSNLAALIHYSATFALGFLLSLYLQAIRGLDAGAAGLVMLVQPVLMALLSPLAGRLSDRIEPRIVASSGMVLTLLGLLTFATIEQGTSLERVLLGLVLVGVGFGLFSSPNTNAVMSSVERRQYGVAAASLGTMRLVGQAVSLALVALVLARFMGAAGVAPETRPQLLRAMRACFTLFAGASAVGAVASLARGRVRE